MPLGKKWRSLDFFGSLENLHLPSYHHHHHKRDKDKHGGSHKKRHPSAGRKPSEDGDMPSEDFDRFSLRPRLSSLSSASERGAVGSETRRDSDPSDGPAPLSGLVQRCVIIQRDERGYGLTVSGDNPVYVASVKPEGAAAKAGVQKSDRIVKVNGTLVTNKNHTDVVRLIKSGAYVALTLMGKPNSATSPGGSQPPSSPSPTGDASNAPGNRNSRITAPQPVAPDKDRELLLQKVHMTQAMYEQAKEDFQKLQRQYVKAPSEKLHTQLLEKERMLKTLENQLRQLTGSDEPSTPGASQGSQRFSDIDTISNTDSASLNSWATSLPVSDLGSMSDSPHTSPSISPTPVHPDNSRTDDSNSLSSRTDSAIEDCIPIQPEQIITIDDEDVNSDDDQAVDTGPFSDVRLLERKPAHMAVFLHYLISNNDPSPFFFYIVTDAFKQTPGSTKDLRKWGYEIFSTFLASSGPLRVAVSESLVTQVADILAAGVARTDNDSILRSMFDGIRAALTSELSEQLADFRSKRDLGLGNIFGVHELKENMDKNSELKMIDKYLTPHLSRCTRQEDSGGSVSDRDLAMGWALATFFRQVGVSKTQSSSGALLERMQSFIMKDKRGFKIPGSRSAKAKAVKGHQFNLQHFYVPTLCAKCEGLIWGVGYQGFLCQSCDMGVHKQCVEDVGETCSGKKRGKRASAFIPVLSASRKTSNPNPQAGERSYSVSEALSQALTGESKSPPFTITEAPGGAGLTQPLRKDDDADFGFALNLIAGLPTEHSVKSIVNRYQELAYPTGPGPGEGDAPTSQSRKASVDLSRSESLKGKGDKTERPARRAKSDVDRDDMFRALNQQSGSSSASSLSNRSAESPTASSESVNDVLSSSRQAQDDSDLEVEDLPPLKQVLGEDVLKKLKPKEKKRQEVINELFHTERAHLRNLKVLDLLFYQPMKSEVSGVMADLARALFPNMDEVIRLHASMNKAMKDRRSQNPVVGDVGDILLERFDGVAGDEFKKACAEYCRNQSFALEALKKHRRKDQRLSQFLAETETVKLCRKLELKDHVPCQMQRLTKYPLLIENLLRHCQNNSQEYKDLEKALERSKHILAYVNTAVRECENFHKLKEMQKKLDKRAIDASADPSLYEIKKLDLTQHKLVYDGPLVWRLRSHRQIDLQVVLLDDILVLLQRADDKLVLKCQSTNLQAIGNDYKYTHSPVLKLQNLLARNVATDKKAFFVINTSDTGPQIYELVAQTQDARKTWCKLINEKAEEHKKSLVNAKKSPIKKSTPSPEREIEPPEPPREPSPPPPPAPDPEDTTDGVFPKTDYQPELIQPDQVDVSTPVTVEPLPVLSPRERLRRTDMKIAQALEEKEQIIAEMLHMSITDYRHLAQHPRGSRLCEAVAGDEQNLVVSCLQNNNHLLQLIAHRAQGVPSDPQLPGLDPTSGSGSGSQVPPSSVASESGPSQLVKQQELLAKGAAVGAVPMDQLRGMANEMNTMLSNLLSVMGTKGEERKSLRSELKAAQDHLEMLKAIQRQMMSQPSPSPSPSTPHSRPLSFASVSESGETTDSDRQDEDPAAGGGGSQLKVAHAQEMEEETPEETVPMVTVQPQVVTPSSPSPTPQPDEDSDDSLDMTNLPLPDDVNVRTVETYSSSSSCSTTTTAHQSSSSTSFSAFHHHHQREPSEPMTTDLDEGGGGEGAGEEEGGRSTPTPPVMMGSVREEEEEREEDRDSITTLCDSQHHAPSQHPTTTPAGGVGGGGGSGGMEEGGTPKTSASEGEEEGGEGEDGINNNNSSSSSGGSRDSQMTNPIEI
ncbi:rho guanine nucleotide exchange factor 11-like isoform X2 [Babylonia areolata]|uniref:rho guanine nucleotide exchange factor 11-like isoform X2 n=1 Tax=Babylonia areolata TaxID=304850 RepID=UPI003FD3D4D4